MAKPIGGASDQAWMDWCACGTSWRVCQEQGVKCCPMCRHDLPVGGRVPTLPEVGSGPAFQLGQVRALIRDALGDIAEARELFEMHPPRRGVDNWAESRLDSAADTLRKALEVSE